MNYTSFDSLAILNPNANLQLLNLNQYIFYAFISLLPLFYILSSFTKAFNISKSIKQYCKCVENHEIFCYKDLANCIEFKHTREILPTFNNLIDHNYHKEHPFAQKATEGKYDLYYVRRVVNLCKTIFYEFEADSFERCMLLFISYDVCIRNISFIKDQPKFARIIYDKLIEFRQNDVFSKLSVKYGADTELWLNEIKKYI